MAVEDIFGTTCFGQLSPCALGRNKGLRTSHHHFARCALPRLNQTKTRRESSESDSHRRSSKPTPLNFTANHGSRSRKPPGIYGLTCFKKVKNLKATMTPLTDK